MNEQPIGRYIAIAIIFVLLFVGVAYLAYRFSRQSSGGTPTFPVASPTPSAPASTGGGSNVPVAIIPAPIQQPVNPYVNPGRIYSSPIPTITTVPSNIQGQAPAFVAHDGKGNLLVNHLTHDEFYQLERLKLENAQALALAKENNSAQVAQLQNQRENQGQQHVLEQARLRQQIELEHLRTVTQRQGQIAQQAHELALQRSDRSYQLIASQTQADIQRSLQTQQYQQQRDNTVLQAQIEANMLKLQAYLNRHQQTGQVYAQPYQPYGASYSTPFNYSNSFNAHSYNRPLGTL